MPPPLQIRPATHSDGPGLARVHAAAIRELCASAYSPEEIEAWSGHLGPDSYARSIDTRLVLVAESDDEIVAFAQLNTPTGEVDAVYVHPASARQGVGARVLRALETIARDSGLVDLFLDSSLNAVPFYAACGYLSQGRTTHRLRAGIDVACERMVKHLPSTDGA